MKGLFLPILSLHQPDKALITEAVLSAIPSIKESSVLEAPRDNKNMGMTAYIILVVVSVRKLVIPMKKTFLCIPSILLLPLEP
jgi:hypothetical protein